MQACSKIAANLNLMCDPPIVGGTRDVVYLFNHDDVLDALISRNIDNDQIIEDIVLESGITGYKVECINNSIMPKNGFVKQGFMGGYNHEINYKVFDLSPDVKKELEKLRLGRFVAIVENVYRRVNGNSAFEIYGLDAGMILESLERDPNNAETQGTYDIVLKTSERSLEQHLPATFFDTDYETTKTIVEALIAA